jgi:hypothetical protein
VRLVWRPEHEFEVVGAGTAGSPPAGGV